MKGSVLARWQRTFLTLWPLVFLALLPVAWVCADDFAPSSEPARDSERAAQQPPAESQFEPAKIIAIVGDEHILAGDIIPNVNQALEPYEGKAPPSELEKQRTLLMKRLLIGAIETKLIYLDFLRLVPADKVPEIHKNVNKKFDSVRIPELLERTKLSSPVELDTKLRSYGSSLAKSRRLFTEQLLAQSMIGRNTKQDPEVTHEEMLSYYREHKAEYEVPAKVRWEELMADYTKFPEDKGISSYRQAYAAIAAMGNEVLRGAKFDAVARRQSHGFTAEQGGYHDWTTKGSLLSKVVDKAIFSLPEGALSDILEDEKGTYIVRVIERRRAGHIPFVEAQVQIKQEIVKQKQDKDRQAYLDGLRKRTPVWTIFDEEGAPLYDPAKQAE